ncbi:sulfotransferase domain-containing protein [Qipengyuania gelatinilytica]|uniref:Sulfotransferase domain-containing protein n=1 Tax=Qipengyuania gelatinilytica TaxID=2867231 RepID=A0ABX8ZY51_9SPHN|nr:sulfotransferase domain-containing protein [Qipengyuania gelatinilytica]QZD93926.1 sulfotransferase domain-containing protein [Qipengyuania gelatinilytica]
MLLGVGRPARNLEEFGANMGSLAQASAPQPYHAIDPRPSDVYITSWAKSGTTLTQQIFHQLRMAHATGGIDMDFTDISGVVPWEDTASMIDFDMTAEQRATPRGFKSHREYERLPAGSRYVVTLRDPHETYVSMHRFFDGWHIEKGAFSLEDFMPLWMGGGPGGCDYFTHLLSWYARAGEDDTLLATYRWVVKNKPAMIRAMGQLIGIEPTDEVVEMVMAATTREFMHDHKDRFDDALVCAVMEERLGIPASSDSTKVQAKGSDATVLPASVTEAIDAMWAERVTPVTGHADFASLAAEIDARFD